MSTQPKYAFHVLLRKTGQDLTTGQTFSKRRTINETKQIDFRSVLKSRSTSIDQGFATSQQGNLDHRI